MKVNEGAAQPGKRRLAAAGASQAGACQRRSAHLWPDGTAAGTRGGLELAGGAGRLPATGAPAAGSCLARLPSAAAERGASGLAVAAAAGWRASSGGEVSTAAAVSPNAAMEMPSTSTDSSRPVLSILSTI
ncbi:MAG TPA: hypothetical protein VE075_06515 [Thermoanaerobaculia bacterium]|nr:hypothetical protein [Thermoanaerobaculia bacterium]